jgi:tetratricopeptide (TPR) repeat protein
MTEISQPDCAIVKVVKGASLGMGFLVDDTHIITCAHVVSSSPPELDSDDIYTPPDDPVAITFLFVDHKRYSAHVEHWVPPLNAACPETQDVAILKLDDPKPNGARPAHLIDHEEEGKVKVYGYPKCFDGKGTIWSEANILGRLHDIDCIQIQHEKDVGIFVQQGFSGAAVWAKELEGVVGMIVSGYTERGIAIAIPIDAIKKAWPPLKSLIKRPDKQIMWNLHHLRNEDFTGRDDLLAALTDALGSEGSLTRPQTLFGMPGVGKTQIAVEYAYRCKERYSIIWWVRAEASLTIIEDYIRLANELGLPARDLKDQSEIVEAVRRYFEENEGWLIIFDNAANIAAVYNYLPQESRGHVLITSRNPVWHNIADVRDVSVFNRRESIVLLTKLTGERDNNVIDDLVAELGDLPLAIVQAGSYCATRHITVSEYLELFRQYQTELLARGEPPAGYPTTVAVTFDIAFDKVRSDCPGAASLLNLIAFLYPDDIPRSLLKRWAPELPDSINEHFKSELDFNDAIAILSKYSLITAESDSIAVHRLVQMRARDRLSGEAAIWAGEAIMMVADEFVFDENDVATWSPSARLLPHGLTAADYAEHYHAAAVSTANFLNGAGRYLKNRAELGEAKSALERAVAIKESIFGEDSLVAAGSKGNLGLVLRALGDLEGAKNMLECVLDVFESSNGSKDLNVAMTLDNLGLVLRDLDDSKAARERFERALSIRTSFFRPDHVVVINTEVNLALALIDLGEGRQAKQLLEHALPIQEATYGPRHPLVATTLGNLGSLHVELHDLHGVNDLDSAKKMLERALMIDEETYSPVHPRVAEGSDNLAEVLSRLGDVDGAKKLHERASDIRDSLEKRRSR